MSRSDGTSHLHVHVDLDRTEDLLVFVALHAPPDVVIGKPIETVRRSAQGHVSLLVDTEPPSVWLADEQHAGVARLTVLPDGRHEVTEWSWGVQMDHRQEEAPTWW